MYTWCCVDDVVWMLFGRMLSWWYVGDAAMVLCRCCRVRGCMYMMMLRCCCDDAVVSLVMWRWRRICRCCSDDGIVLMVMCRRCCDHDDETGGGGGRGDASAILAQGTESQSHVTEEKCSWHFTGWFWDPDSTFRNRMPTFMHLHSETNSVYWWEAPRLNWTSAHL